MIQPTAHSPHAPGGRPRDVAAAAPTRRSLLLALALTLAGHAAQAGQATPAEPRGLTVALQADGGLGSAAALRTVYLDPFRAEAPRLAITSWPGGLAALKAGAADWDVMEIDATTLYEGCTAGLVEKLRWGDPPLAALRDKLLAQGSPECGLGVLMQATVLAWDRGKVQGSLTWSDFWDVVKSPGKRALQAGARGNLEAALLADGVLPGDVYKVLRSDDGLKRALRRLTQLRPYLIWWETPEEALRILETGDALMASLPAPLVVSANAQSSRAPGGRLAMQPQGGLVSIRYFAIASASPNRELGLRLLAFAADPARQALLAEQGAWAGTAKGVNDKLPPELAARSPGTTQALAAELLIDPAFWREHGDRLTAEFNAAMAR